MNWLLRRSLVRRVALSLLLAFTLAWLAVVVYLYVSFRLTMHTDSGVVRVGRELNTTLAEIQREDVAAAVIDALARQINAMRVAEADLPGDVVFMLRNRE